MKILSINIRATQGGAGRMGYDLHKRLQASGCDVRLLYGYGSGIAPDHAVADEPEVMMIGTRATVLGNYASHWLVGQELFTSGRETLQESLAWADIVHVHAAHHWYLRWSTFVGILRGMAKPVVITAHDWWLITGRCGFVRDCTGWQRSCGECGNRRFQDLPSLFDFSRSVRVKRRSGVRSLAENLAIVCPSQHLQRDHQAIFPDLDVRFIPNALDREYESVIEALPKVERRGIVFCASDLDSPGKIDADMVRALAASHGASVELIGRNNPFHDIGATVHGEIRDRAQLARVFNAARALIFTSQMDNAPLTIIEALVSGCHVVAYPSPAAAEMLTLVGGRCASSPAEARLLIDSGREADLYGGIDADLLAERARTIWSGQRLVDSYIGVYHDLISRRVGQSA